MSEENVKVVRDAFEAYNAGDMDRLHELYHPDAIIRGLADWPEPGPGVGRDAIMRQFMLQREAFDEDSLELLGDPLATGDRVIVRTAWNAAGRGPAMNMEVTIVYTIRKGLVLEVEFFRDHDEALEAVGLSK